MPTNETVLNTSGRAAPVKAAPAEPGPSDAPTDLSMFRTSVSFGFAPPEPSDGPRPKVVATKVDLTLEPKPAAAAAAPAAPDVEAAAGEDEASQDAGDHADAVLSQVNARMSPIRQRAMITSKLRPSSARPDTTLTYVPPALPPQPIGVDLSNPPSTLGPHGARRQFLSLEERYGASAMQSSRPSTATLSRPSTATFTRPSSAVTWSEQATSSAGWPSRPQSANPHSFRQSTAYTAGTGFTQSLGFNSMGMNGPGPSLRVADFGGTPSRLSRPSTAQPIATYRPHNPALARPLSASLAQGPHRYVARIFARGQNVLSDECVLHPCLSRLSISSSSSSRPFYRTSSSRPSYQVNIPLITCLRVDHPFQKPLVPIPEPAEDPKKKKAPPKKAPPPKKGAPKETPPVVSFVCAMKAVLTTANINKDWLAKPSYKVSGAAAAML